MELVTVTKPPPEVPHDDPAYVAWKQAEYIERGALCLKQSAQIKAMAMQVRELEGQISSLMSAVAGPAKAPETPDPRPEGSPGAPVVPEDYTPHPWVKSLTKAGFMQCGRCQVEISAEASKEQVLALGSCPGRDLSEDDSKYDAGDDGD